MYVAEEWAKRFRDETKAAHQARETAEDHLSVLRTQQKQLAEQVKKANQDKASAEEKKSQRTVVINSRARKHPRRLVREEYPPQT